MCFLSVSTSDSRILLPTGEEEGIASMEKGLRNKEMWSGDELRGTDPVKKAIPTLHQPSVASNPHQHPAGVTELGVAVRELTRSCEKTGT